MPGLCSSLVLRLVLFGLSQGGLAAPLHLLVLGLGLVGHGGLALLGLELLEESVSVSLALRRLG